MTQPDWKARLTPEQYRVLREKGTEFAFTGKYVNHHDDGMYVCAGCGASLFSSQSKFDSGSGWPSFDRAVSDEVIELKDDTDHGMNRVEVVCKSCGGHLGHLFNDGPTDTKKRFCVNSASLNFKDSKNRSSSSTS